jgi:hypothetical protein
MIIAVDFDGTIVEHEYPRIGRPIPFAIEVLKKLQREERHTLLLWTVREGELLRRAVDYCAQQGLTFYAINKNYPEEQLGDKPRKLSADLFIDDKGISGIPDWGVIYRMIKSGTNGYQEMDDYDYDYNHDSDENKYKKKKNLFSRLGEAWDTAQRYR